MALNPSTLQDGMLNALLLGLAVPPANAPSETIAIAMAAAVDAYSREAQTCAGTPLASASLTVLEDGMKDALFGDNPDGQAAAQKWLIALEAYWATATFATGTIVARTGGPALVLSLAATFDDKPDPPLFKAPVDAASGISSAVDSYTRAITAVDTAGGGCGPAPLQ